MRILFVCRANICRSQIAESLFNKYSGELGNDSAQSAGTCVFEKEGQEISNIKETSVIKVMNQEGIDISKNKRNQLTLERMIGFDKIIVMAEEETIPDFLKADKRVIYWNIPDPKGGGYDLHYNVREELRGRVLNLLNHIK